MFLRFIGLWSLLAGVSLLYTFFVMYRARGRYLYLFLFGTAAFLWGLETVLLRSFMPRGVIWIILALGLVWMVMDSLRRYRDTSYELRRRREERLNAPLEEPSEDRDDAV
jgi:membrane protein implicated in regulation of membrane protease activity